MSDLPEFEFSTVLASTVHDVKNSLGVLMQNLQSLAEHMQERDDELAGQAGLLNYEAGRVNSGLVQLLALYRLDQKSLPIIYDEVFLDEFLEDLCSQHGPVLAEKEASLDCKVEEDLDGFFDPSLVATVLNSLINNSIRYCNSKIEVSASRQGEMLMLQVADDGEGYSEELLALGGRSPAEATLPEGNTGLGLYFAARIAALHKAGDRAGYIRLSNGSPLPGGCFRLYLPM